MDYLTLEVKALMKETGRIQQVTVHMRRNQTIGMIHSVCCERWGLNRGDYSLIDDSRVLLLNSLAYQASLIKGKELYLIPNSSIVR